MLGFLLRRGLKVNRMPMPDYNMHLPGATVGRLVEAGAFDARPLGPWLVTMRPSGFPLALDTSQIFEIARGVSSFRGIRTLAFAVAGYALRRIAGQRPVKLGASLAAQLMIMAQRLNVAVRLNCALRKVVFEDGRAVGAIVESGGAPHQIRARRGVILCAGGFAHDADFRRKVQGLSGEWSSASADDTGDVVKMADELGAAVAGLDQAWWGPTLVYPSGRLHFTISDRSLPGTMMVDAVGRRFTNESQSYNDVGLDMIRNHLQWAWLIVDGRSRKRYFFGTAPPGVTPTSLIKQGFFIKTGSLKELASRCGMDPEVFGNTVKRFNSFADTGVDVDFSRGSSEYDRYGGDPKVRPNPNLGRIHTPPFLATRLYLGDLGTKGGLVTDEHARVLRPNGSVIDGLYAGGNTTASVMGKSYPGPGATLGAAMTFGYIAAVHILGNSSIDCDR